VVGNCWFVDETYEKVSGNWRYVDGRSTSTAVYPPLWSPSCACSIPTLSTRCRPAP